MRDKKIAVITPVCPVCKGDSIVTVPEDGYRKWRGGEYIQDALPELSPDERELLVSGLHPECWDQLFGVEDE